MEKYVVDGQGFNVAPEDLEMFLQQYRNAEKYEEPGQDEKLFVGNQTIGLKPSDDSLDQPKEIGAWQSFKNNMWSLFL